MNGQYINDSNAGHSDDLALESSYLTTFSANGPFGNAMVTSLFNPFLGANGINPVNDQYWDASVDFEYRAPVGDTVFTLQGEAIIAQYTSVLPNGAVINELLPGNSTVNGVPTAGSSFHPVNNESLNIGGAELQASIGDNPWILAGRFAMVIPDSNMVGTYSYTAIVGGVSRTYAFGQSLSSTPIFEITLPSITWKMNEDVKLVAEAQWLINEPEATSNSHATPGTAGYSASGDGTYLLTQMPSQFAAANVSTSGSIIPVGNMMLQLQF